MDDSKQVEGEEFDNTDGRGKYEYISKYDSIAQKDIAFEMKCLLAALGASLILLFLIWNGWLHEFLLVQQHQAQIFTKYAFYAISGLLGGLVFGMKYFYRAVAKGYWNLDRRAWRIMSPLVSMIIAVIFGAMIDAGLTSSPKPISSSTIVAIGFFAGYFADEAVGKMYEIASVIFGRSQVKDAKK